MPGTETAPMVIDTGRETDLAAPPIPMPTSSMPANEQMIAAAQPATSRNDNNAIRPHRDRSVAIRPQ
jgi:hypothetical protein